MNSAHARAAQYGVDGGRQKFKTWLYLEKEGVLALIACLDPTGSAYFGSDGFKLKVRNEFTLLHPVQTYIRLDDQGRTVVSPYVGIARKQDDGP